MGEGPHPHGDNRRGTQAEAVVYSLVGVLFPGYVEEIPTGIAEQARDVDINHITPKIPTTPATAPHTI